MNKSPKHRVTFKNRNIKIPCNLQVVGGIGDLTLQEARANPFAISQG